MSGTRAFSVVRRLEGHGRRVPGIVPRNCIHHKCAIRHVLGYRPDLVQRASEGHQPVPAHRPVSRLQPHHPAEGRRLADAASGVGAQRVHRLPRRHRSRRSPAAPPRHPTQVPRVPRREVRRVLRRRPHSELVQVPLPHHNRPRLPQPLRYVSVVGRHEALQHLRRTGCANAPGAQVVLQHHRDPVQRPHRPLSSPFIRRPGLHHCPFPCDRDERLDPLVHILNASQYGLRKLCRGYLAARQ